MANRAQPHHGPPFDVGLAFERNVDPDTEVLQLGRKYDHQTARFSVGADCSV